MRYNNTGRFRGRRRGGRFCVYSESGYKVTEARKLVLESFLENSNKRMSAYEVYDIITKSNNFIGMASIYRTIDLLVDLGVLLKAEVINDCWYYELSNSFAANKDNHCMCRKCGSIVNCSDFLSEIKKEFEEFKFKLINKNGFQVDGLPLIFKGICSACNSDIGIKNMDIIKVAIPCSENKGIESLLSGHFGHSDYFIIIELENGSVNKVYDLKNIVHETGMCNMPVELLINNGVKVVIGKGIGHRPFNYLKNAGIDIYYDSSDRVKESLDKFSKGMLIKITRNQICSGGM